MIIRKAYVSLQYRATMAATYEVPVPPEVSEEDAVAWAIEHFRVGKRTYSEELTRADELVSDVQLIATAAVDVEHSEHG